MTDNTQELDEILNKAIVVSTSPVPLSLNDEAVIEVRLRYQDLIKQAILDWHNKQVEKLLSNPQPTYARSLKNLGEFLERYNLDIGLAEDKENMKKWSDAIQAERERLGK